MVTGGRELSSVDTVRAIKTVALSKVLFVELAVGRTR